MIQNMKEYQRGYFEANNYKIYENIQEAGKAFCEIYPHSPSITFAIDSITNDTNCDWVILNDGSVAVHPLVFSMQEKSKKLHTRITKCYLVQVLNDDGDEVASEYTFVNTQKEAARAASRLKRDYILNNK